MVASKDTRNYTGSGRSPTPSFRDSSSACSLVECSEVLKMGYARRVREVGEPRGAIRMKSRESIHLEGCPGCPYIKQGHATYKEIGSPDRAVVNLKEETSYLGVQGTSSCLGVSVRPSVVVVTEPPNYDGPQYLSLS
jgi:hypothetical protein